MAHESHFILKSLHSLARELNPAVISLALAIVVSLSPKPDLAASYGPTVWVVPSILQRIGPFDSAGNGDVAEIFAARGETQSFQISVHAPLGGLSNVNFSTSDLQGPAGAVIPAADVILYREHYIAIHHHSPGASPNRELPVTAT